MKTIFVWQELNTGRPLTTLTQVFDFDFYLDYYCNWLLDTFIYIWCVDAVLNTRMFLKSAWICVLLEECIISNNQRKMGEICKPGSYEWGRPWFPFLVSFRHNMIVSWWTPLLVKIEFFVYLVIVSNCYLFCYFPSQYSQPLESIFCPLFILTGSAFEFPIL